MFSFRNCCFHYDFQVVTTRSWSGSLGSYQSPGGIAKHGITICKDGGIGLGADPSIELETPEYINIYTYGERSA